MIFLYVGPNLVPLLFEIIMRCRYHLYFVSCDISKGFLRFILHPAFRDYVRFFVRSDWLDPNSQDQIWRFWTVLFGSASSPYLLQATIHAHLDRMDANELKSDLFVDDLFRFANNLEEVFAFQRKATYVFNPLWDLGTNSST